MSERQPLARKRPVGWPLWSGVFLVLALMGPWLLMDPAFAHVRWFTDPSDPALVRFPLYSLTDVPVLVWIGIGMFFVSLAVVLDGRLPVLPIVNTKIRHDAMELMRILTGMSLLLTAYNGDLIAPHMTAYGNFGLALVFLQALIGILLISNHFVHHAAILLVLLLSGTMIQFGFVKAFEYVNFIGIALFLFFNHFPDSEVQRKLKP